jgi:hypothetical protein
MVPTSYAPKACGYVQVTGLSSAGTLGAIPAGSVYAIIQVESQPVRWRDDGTSPTTASGMQMNVGDVLIYDGQLAAIKFIEITASAKLNVSFFGPQSYTATT